MPQHSKRNPKPKSQKMTEPMANNPDYSQEISALLELNAYLASISEEPTLLLRAVEGVTKVLQLNEVTIFKLNLKENHWTVQITNTKPTTTDRGIPQELLDDLNAILHNEMVGAHMVNGGDGRRAFSILHPLGHGENLIGAMLFKSGFEPVFSQDTFFLLTQSFAKTVAAFWQNLMRLQDHESHPQARDLESLHGRFLKGVWQGKGTSQNIRFSPEGIEIEPTHSPPPALEQNRTFPVLAGSQTIGQIELPEAAQLSPEDSEYLQSLVQEMGNALNNANLLQTAREFANQLSLAAEVSQAANTILDRDKLIQAVVELIRSHFNYYYVGLFLIDEMSHKAVLQAGTGEAGRMQVANQHQLVIGGPSMIGTAVASGEAIVEQDVTLAKAFKRNPLLPETRSEAALPLRSREKIIGAFTVQSAHIGAFTPDTVSVMQTMADQLAIAIENATLFNQVQKTLADTNRLYQASRKINESTSEEEIFQMLVAFAQESGLADIAHVIIVNPKARDYYISPAFWSRMDLPYKKTDRFPRDKFRFGKRLEENKLIIIPDIERDPSLDRLSRYLFTHNQIRSTAMIGIQTEQEWLGTLALHSTEPNRFQVSELQSFITLADQTAVILSNMQLLNQAKSLYQIGQDLSQSLTRDDAFEIAVREVSRYTGASQCCFILYDKSQAVGTIAAEAQPTPVAPAVRLPMKGDPIYEQMLADGRPVLIEEEEITDPEIIRRYLYPFGAKAGLLIPAASQQELMGFMGLYSLRGLRPFRQSNIVFAQTVVDQLTTQIENLKLLDEALFRAQEMITLNQIQSRISRVLDMSKLARSIYTQVGQLLDNTVFLLATFDPDTKVLEPILSIDRGQAISEPPRLLEEHDLLFQFLQRSKAITAESILLTRPSGSAPPPKSGIWVPLHQEGQPIGLLTVQSYEQDAYSENDAQLLRSIATQTSLAITNSRLFEHIQASNEELRKLDHLKTQFLANMSHELRTPLNSIIGFSRVILKGIDGPVTSEQREDLTSIFNNGHHLLSLINEILDMAKIEAGKMPLAFEPVNLDSVARQAFSTIRSLIDPEKVELILDMPPDLPPFQADPVRIRQILVNLLSNAAKYTQEGHIRLWAKAEEDYIHTAVEDTGIGIAKEDFDRLFVAFEQVDNSTTRQVGGTGLGLPITRWLISSHQGEIWLESEVGLGSTFHFTIPLEQSGAPPIVATLTEPHLTR